MIWFLLEPLFQEKKKIDLEKLVSENYFIFSNSTYSNERGLLELIKKKDLYTYFHCIRVGIFSRKIGELLDYNEERLRQLTKAALLHDLGKIYISDEIVKSNGKLNYKEFETMKKHCILEDTIIINSIEPKIYEAIKQHHERNDGSGYPFGLKEKDICEEAKIIGICDSYDAMTSKRHYAEPIPISDALFELKTLSPTKYDLKLVNLFELIIKNHF